MIKVIILNAVNGVYQSSLYGVVAVLPFEYTNAIVLGNNICGTFISVLSIITLVGMLHLVEFSLYSSVFKLVVLALSKRSANVKSIRYIE